MDECMYDLPGSKALGKLCLRLAQGAPIAWGRLRLALIFVVVASSSASVARASATATVLTASNPAPTAGTTMTLTATLTPTTATGAVTFLDGATVLGTATLTNGVANCTVTAIALGAHSYTASYAGDAADPPSTSAALAITAVAGAVLGTDPAIPSNLAITSFAAGLNYPYGMVQLPDSSLLVATSNPSTTSFYGPTTLQLYRFTTTNGVAGPPTLALDNGSPGPATGMAAAGNIIAVATGANTGSQILILQADASDALAQLGAIAFTYPPGAWQHDSHTVALRAVPGQTGVYQLLFSLGSQAGSAATPLAVQIGLSGLVTQQLVADSLYSVQFTVNGTTITADPAVQLANGLRNPFALTFAANGDIYLVDNGQDVGLSSVATSADVFDIIPAGTASVLNFGFPNTFADPLTGVETGPTDGITLPTVPFTPLSGGDQKSQGAAGMALSPTNFPATLSNGIIVGFFGANFGSLSGSYWDPVIYCDLGTGHYFDLIPGGETGVGPILSMLAIDGAWYLADLGSSNGAGVIYKVSVAPPAFLLSATAAAVTPGSTSSSTVTVTPKYGFDSNVTLAASNWPAGITAAFASNPVAASSLVTINVSPGVAPGPYSLTVNGASDTLSASATIALAINAPVQPTATALAAYDAAPIAGTNMTLTATVAPSAATGTVTFFDGPTPLGNGALSGGVATYTVSAIAAGTHSYTASYAGYTSYVSYGASSSSSVPIMAQPVPSFSLSATPATASAGPPGTYIAYGDSITYGAAASSTANQYTNLIASDLSALLTNRGVGSTQACDMAQTIMSNDNPPESQAPLQTTLIGTNDAFVKGAGPYESVFRSCHTASLAWLAIPSSQKIAAQSCTQSGYWEPDTTYLPGIAAKSYSPGAALSCSVASYGGPLYLWYRVTDSNAGVFTYSVDGGPPQPVNSFSSTPIATWIGGVNGVFVVRIPGLAAGTHTVLVTVTSSSVSILAVGSLNPQAEIGAPEVFAGGVIREQYDSIAASTAAYDADAAADVALLSGDGLPVYFVPVRNFVNADTDMFDGFHPNDTGHLHLRDAFESLSQFPLNSPASFSSTLTVTPANGFNSAVTLAASGWPAGITGAFGTNPAASSSTVTISVASSVAPGPYTLTVNGSSGGLSANATIPITVPAPPSFTLSATAATVSATSPGTSTVTVTPTNGFHSVVELSPSNWPAGITATFGTNPTTASSTVTISVTASVAPGPYMLTLSGTLGTFSATTTVALTVTAVQGLMSSAIFTGLDTSTQGNWSPAYGADGYLIANGANNLPAYASVAFTGASTFTWSGWTSDVRALQSAPGSAARIASCYYSVFSGNFSVSLNLTDGATHQIAIYLVDWDTNLRSQTVTIADSASGILLDSRSFSQFSNGFYGVWNIKGNVTVNVTANGAGGAVASAIFFGPVVASAPPSFTLSAAAAAATVGSTGTSTVTVTPANGFNSGVTLAASGWPAGITGTFATNPATASSMVTISVGASVAPGPYTLTVNGASGLLSAGTAIALIVTAPAGPPAISNVAVSNIANSSATITWTTDQASSSQVNFGTTTGYGSSSTLNPTLVTSHSVTLTGLTLGTAYNFDVVSANAGAMSSTSGNAAFMTTSVVSLPPAIANVVTTNLTSTSVTVTWTTDQPSSSQANYGKTTSYGSSSPLDTTLVTAHSVTLSGLAPGTAYDFDVASTNAAAQSTTSPNASFSTPASTATPPYVGYVAAWGINNTGATVTWSTDVPANTQLAYGATTALGQLSPLQTAMAASHGVTLTGLISGTQYYFVAQSTGADGATGYSAVMTFTTTGTAPAGPPNISSVLVSNIANTSATVTWTTDQASSSQVNFGATTGYGSSSTLDPTLATSHTVTLTGLTLGTTYDFDVVSANAGAMSSTSPNAVFTTTNVVYTPPVIAKVTTTSLTSNSVTVTWTTDQPASSQVSYGATTGYGSSSTLDPNLVTAHSVTLTGLTAGTAYDFDVASTNAAAQSTTSPNSTFTTPATTATPPYVGYVAAWGINNTGATVTWSTDVSANTQLAYGTSTALGQMSPLQAAMAASHGVTLTGLNPGTQYYFVAQSTGADGATGYSAVMTFTTTGTQTAPPPTISSVAVNSIANTSAIVTWSTDQAASSQVSYGVTTMYTLSSTLDPALLTAHSVTLTGLMPGTQYDFDVMSANSLSIPSTSSNATFTTTGTAPGPVISNIGSSGVMGGTATVNWTTDEASTSVVNYGTTTGYGSSVSVDGLVTTHSVTLTGLSPSTAYDFDVASANSANTTSTSANQTFRTTSNTAPPPVISYLSYWGITASEATITWSTNELTNTAVAYGTTNALDQLSPVQTTLSYSHGVTLTGLAPGTTYYFAAQSADGSGNTGYSATFSFTTIQGPPTISGVTANPAANNTAAINWTTSAPTYSYVQFGTTAGVYYAYSAQTALTASPNCILSYVPSGTIHYQLVSTDAIGNQVASPDMTFVEP